MHFNFQDTLTCLEPLDSDEGGPHEDAHASEMSDEERSEDEKQVRKKARKISSKKSWQEGFTCMSKHDGKGKSTNPNAYTIEILQRMADYFELSRDQWRPMAINGIPQSSRCPEKPRP